MTKPPEKNRFSKKTAFLYIAFIVGIIGLPLLVINNFYIPQIQSGLLALDTLSLRIVGHQKGDSLGGEEEIKEEAEITSNSWVPPSGFKQYNDNIAYKWSEKGSYTCNYGNSCIQMEVVTEKGCSNLYVGLSSEDKEGNNIGWTNETTTGLEPDQRAILLFNILDEGTSYMKITEILCY